MGRIKLKTLAKGALVVGTGGLGAGALAIVEAKKQKKKVESNIIPLKKLKPEVI